MTHRVWRRLAFVAIFAAVALAVAACGQKPPAAEKQPTKITIGIEQEPDSLNPYLAVMTYSRIVRRLAVEGLFQADLDGNYVPLLAAELPTAENGGISADGLTVTYKLKPGITYSDGHPLTSEDIKFTWQAIMDPNNTVPTRAGYELIDSIETPDATTAVVKFKQLYAPFMGLFRELLPKHVFQSTAINDPTYNRTPEGTGPFIIKEWQSGNYILAEKNPSYRVAGKPQVDQIIFKIVADREAAIAELKSGGVDIANIPEDQGATAKEIAGVNLPWAPQSGIEYLQLNMSDPKNLNRPHPILGDVNVRKAIALAIDKKSIVDQLLSGYGSVATSALPVGWFADPSVKAPDYDPEQAKAILDQAGWKDADGDGIREKGGKKLSLKIMAPAGSQIREKEEQIMAENLKAVGIELVIDNQPASVMFGNWANNGPLQRGNFDIAADYWGPDADPSEYMALRFASSNIPSETTAGWNFGRMKLPEVDQALQEASSTLDLNARRAAYTRAAQAINDTYAYIPLYSRALIWAVRTNIDGVKVSTWEELTWNAQDWMLMGQ